MTALKKTADAHLPRHVAIIMDGNGRWAAGKGLPRVEGHRQGMKAVRRTVKAATRRGIDHLTLFAFSSENWRRPRDEVDALMGLLRIYLNREIKKLHKEGVRIRFIGDRSALAGDIRRHLQEAEKLTQSNTRLILNIALNYGGRQDILQAARTLARACADGRITADDIDEEALSRHLFTRDMPDPDLLIRTSGEQRISNFLLWQCAYAEFVFTDTLWPDFDNTDFDDAVGAFMQRERRYGART